MAISKIENSSLATGVPGTSQLPAGSVLQVVNGQTQTQVSSTSGSYVDTTLGATITPTSATSKILVLVSQNGVMKAPGANTYVTLILLRNATGLSTFGYPECFETVNTYQVGSPTVCYLDSPATTSAITYKTQFAVVGGVSVQVQRDSTAMSTITLMEIAA